MPELRVRSAAIFAALTFLLGTIALPALHLAFHELPHHHDGGHHHDDGTAGHHHDGEAAEHHHEEQPEPEHGEGSLAHFAVAISSAPATLEALAWLGLIERGFIAPVEERRPTSAHVAVARFRGPPLS